MLGGSSPEDGFRNFTLLKKNVNNGQSPRPGVSMTVIHHRQSPVVSHDRIAWERFGIKSFKKKQ